MKLHKYICNELVHWTGRGQDDESAVKALTSICEDQILRLSYCPNYVHDDYKPEAAMVFFRDIPLKYAREYSSKFRKFGMGFNKNKMVQYRANPALYTTGQHFVRIMKLGGLLARMGALEKDPR